MTDLSDELAALPAPWPSVFGLLNEMSALADTRHRQTQACLREVERLWQEIGDLRDELNTRALKAVPPLCVVCGTAIEPDARYFTCDGAPRHLLCDEATV